MEHSQVSWQPGIIIASELSMTIDRVWPAQVNHKSHPAGRVGFAFGIRVGLGHRVWHYAVWFGLICLPTT